MSTKTRLVVRPPAAIGVGLLLVMSLLTLVGCGRSGHGLPPATATMSDESVLGSLSRGRLIGGSPQLGRPGSLERVSLGPLGRPHSGSIPPQHAVVRIEWPQPAGRALQWIGNQTAAIHFLTTEDGSTVDEQTVARPQDATESIVMIPADPNQTLATGSAQIVATALDSRGNGLSSGMAAVSITGTDTVGVDLTLVPWYYTGQISSATQSYGQTVLTATWTAYDGGQSLATSGWSSSNPEIVSVGLDGSVIWGQSAGTASVTAESPDGHASASIVLESPGSSATAASATIGTGASAITYTAVTPGTVGNGMVVWQFTTGYVSINVANETIIVDVGNLTAAEVAAAVNSTPEAAALVHATTPGGGSGLPVAGPGRLSGGTGSPPGQYIGGPDVQDANANIFATVGFLPGFGLPDGTYGLRYSVASGSITWQLVDASVEFVAPVLAQASFPMPGPSSFALTWGNGYGVTVWPAYPLTSGSFSGYFSVVGP